MLKKFAIELLIEVADECESRLSENVLFGKASDIITEVIESLVEETPTH